MEDLELGLNLLAGPDAWESVGWQLALPEPRQKRFADPPEGETGEGDPELARAQEGVEPRDDVFRDAGPPVPGEGQFVDPTARRRNDGELGGDEETVEQHQEQGEENQAEVGEIGRGGVTGGRVHEGVW